MFAITRTPRILVKLAGAPERVSFRLDGKPVEAQFERLFQNIRPEAAALGAAAAPEWHVLAATRTAAEVNSWDLCHQAVTEGLGVAGLPSVTFAEPDLEQEWVTGQPVEHAMAAARTCDNPENPDPRLPSGEGFFWFRDTAHSQLEAARKLVGEAPDPVRIAHFDTGYDPAHVTLPRGLRRDLQRNFVEGEAADEATDHTSGVFTNLGHGTGTLSILAGAELDGVPLGGAPQLEVVPLRVANSVVLFKNSAIARAFDYVHGLFADPASRAHVITMSMGGLASQAWADAVNALYELGVFIVTAAGNNFANLPTHNIVYPARFGRVVAACGVMADGRPYADLPPHIMAGNYGPSGKMKTAISAYTPNAPWARLGCSQIVDRDGRGTSSATPQVAASAALWIQRHKQQWEAYPEGWMRVEAVRKALFDSAAPAPDAEFASRLGRGIVRAGAALAQPPAEASVLRKQPVDAASFPFLRVITGLGAAGVSGARERMLELEALQLSQRSKELERLLPDPLRPGPVPDDRKQRIIEALIEAPGASQSLRAALEPQRTRIAAVPGQPVPELPGPERARIALALNPSIRMPEWRNLRVFAFDPMLGYNPEFLQINETTLKVKWEDVQPGPVGEYVQIIDVDPATGCCYAPVDLNHPAALAQDGLGPAESNPQFHQQMVYAVAMKTIASFERALGRVALWAPRFVKNSDTEVEKHFVRRLRIYPHAVREANAYYSPDKKALLLGYFPASRTAPGRNLPGGTVFCALSHDIIAHETTHALLDGLHRYFGEPTNQDVLAFHEAFADIVALFQHFTIPEALRDQIGRTRGDLSKQNLLGELAQQFGQGIGRREALRSAIGKQATYQEATEPHDRGAVLVAAVFDAFLSVYRRRSEDLVRLATGGTGVLSPGAIPHDLVNRLSAEAAKTAGQVLNICVRALDYCPPVDLNFGEYLRALITADRDLVAEDRWGFRPAFVEGFRVRGIYPENVRNLSPQSLCWETPDLHCPVEEMLDSLQLTWSLRADRRTAFDVSQQNGARVHQWLKRNRTIDTEALGFFRDGGRRDLNGAPGWLREFEVHAVRPVRRIGPDDQQQTDLVIEITQSWLPDSGGKFRGGCTLLIDLEKRAIRYVIRKRTGHPERVRQQEAHQLRMAEADPAVNYFGPAASRREPFAMLHRSFPEARA